MEPHVLMGDGEILASFDFLCSALGADAGGGPLAEPEAGGPAGAGQRRGAPLCGVLPPGPAHGGDAHVPAQTPARKEHQLQLQQR